MKKGHGLAARIDPAHLSDYLARKLTSAQVARLYGVKSRYVTRSLPKRPPREQVDLQAKATLRAARNNFRDRLALETIAGKYKVREAAELAHCSQSTMFRHLRKVRHAV